MKIQNEMYGCKSVNGMMVCKLEQMYHFYRWNTVKRMVEQFWFLEFSWKTLRLKSFVSMMSFPACFTCAAARCRSWRSALSSRRGQLAAAPSRRSTSWPGGQLLLGFPRGVHVAVCEYLATATPGHTWPQPHQGTAGHSQEVYVVVLLLDWRHQVDKEAGSQGFLGSSTEKSGRAHWR